MTNRKDLGKRLRFEILKRDGFRCRYCGATPDQQVLHVDHVVPVADGGTNDPVNLVASCQPCNSGKAHKGLDQRSAPIPHAHSVKEFEEQREQIAAYLAAQRAIEEQRSALTQVFADAWESQIGPMTEGAYQRLRTLLGTVDHTLIMAAIEATGQSKIASPGRAFSSHIAVRQLKYFNAVVRNAREGREWRKW